MYDNLFPFLSAFASTRVLAVSAGGEPLYIAILQLLPRIFQQLFPARNDPPPRMRPQSWPE